MRRGAHNNHRKSKDHYLWSEDRKMSSHGYVKVRVGIEHPLADPNGYAYEHLIVWVSAGNPKPQADEVLHHKNECKTDNRISNLAILKREQHSVSHNATLSDAQVRAIREAYAAGTADMPELARLYAVPVQRISRFIRGDTRRSAGGPLTLGDKRKHTAGRLLDGQEWNEMPL